MTFEELGRKVYLFRMPIMVRSEYCGLKGASDGVLCKLGECPLDARELAIRIRFWLKSWWPRLEYARLAQFLGVQA